MKKSCLRLFNKLLLLLFFYPGSAFAQTPDQIVLETTREVLDRLQNDREELEADPGHIKVIVRDLIVPHMDFDTMSGLALGREWNILSREVKTCFSNGFRNLLVERYSHILLSYRNQDISYQPARGIGEKGYMSVVQTLTRDDKKPLTIGYPMRPTGESWQVVDLVIDDVSLIRSYRMMFEKEINTIGLADFIYSFQECSP